MPERIARLHAEPTTAVACSPSLDEMREAGIAGTLRHRLLNAGGHAVLDGEARTIPIILCLNKVHCQGFLRPSNAAI